MSKQRIKATLDLQDDVRRVRQISDTRADILSKLGIHSVKDLILYAPFRYIDFTGIIDIAASTVGEKATVVGTVDSINSRKLPHRRMTITTASIVDDSGLMNITWFNQPWIADKIAVGSTILAQGVVEHYGGFKQMSSPIYRVLENGIRDVSALGVLPVYRSKQGLGSQLIGKFVSNAMDDSADGFLDPIPAGLRIENHLIGRQSAFENLHHPSDMAQVAQAKRRLGYEEMLMLQLHWLKASLDDDGSQNGFEHFVEGKLLKAFKASLPFALTDDQQRAIEDVLGDMASPKRMNRMVLGDVGTGKTMVAAAALASVCDSDSQGAFMAPTEVLANQYANSLGPIFDQIGIRWALLTASVPASRKREISEGLATGQINVVFGTHAILEDDIEFASLTLAIIDEQHRFGVGQREKLKSKGERCDYLCMTATPIPRSLALTIYGTLECSYIKQKPSGNRPIETKVVSKKNRFIAFDAIRDAVANGQQAYIVCPLIGEESSDAAEDSNDEEDGDALEPAPLTEFDLDEISEDLVAAKKEVKYLQANVFPEMRIDLLCGAMKADEKDEVMSRFRRGEIDVLVSTTVIEVGVDVPNATVMVIEDAERFGLSQLHQLRGRVGRGEHPGKAVLIASTNTEESAKRMSFIERTQDGFELAELDLSLRKEGDVVGSRQHGLPSLRFTNVIRDAKMIEKARKDAKSLLDRDPSLSLDEHALLGYELKLMFPQDD